MGFCLNVHEGPQNMRWRFTGGMVEAVFEDGMDITNEPGIYIQGSHGIRIENVMVAKNDVKNEYGQFMHFETLTWVPVDREAIDEKYLNDTQIKYLHEYQKTVYEKISPYLNEEEKEWLAQYAKRKLEQEHFDYFIFGHRHMPMEIKVGENSLYMNLGDWVNHFTYAVFDGTQLKLERDISQ